METYSEIVLKSSLILAVFYVGYVIVLSRETSFRQNRIFLLSGVVLSLFVPFIQFPVPAEYQPYALIQLKTVEILSSGEQVSGERSLLSFGSILKMIYLIGVLLLIIRFLSHLWIISRFRSKSKIIKNSYGKVVYTGKRHPVFSFLNYVFIDVESECSTELDVILEHERVHIVQLHSIDLLLLEVLAIVQWFNPMVWLYLKSIKQNHEYLADQGVIKNGFPLDTYQYVLLNNYSALGFGFANSFNQSLTFKRLMMMKKNESYKSSAFKLLILFPFIFLWIISVSSSFGRKISNDAKPYEYGVSDKNGIYSSYAIDLQPEFQNGDHELVNFICNNIVYPEQAKKVRLQGTINVKFVVQKDGKIGSIQVLKNSAQRDLSLLENEAIRVVSLIPVWKPGMLKGKPVDVYCIMPIKFRLQS